LKSEIEPPRGVPSAGRFVLDIRVGKSMALAGKEWLNHASRHAATSCMQRSLVRSSRSLSMKMAKFA
jgi:hypothetical protein